MEPWSVCVFPAERIAARVAELGRSIRERFPDQSVTLLGVLKGSAIFTADLARAVSGAVELSFLFARSYGDARRSSGSVQLGEVEADVLEDRNVVVVDTVLDSGRTLDAVLRRVAETRPRALASCVLLAKSVPRAVPVEPDWVGFGAPDRFLVGYGLDVSGRCRALPYVAALGEEDGDGG